MEFQHVSVLLQECIDGLAIRPDGIYVDGTTGGGGHSLEIVKRLTTGRLICIDQDLDAHAAAKIRLAEYLDKIIPGMDGTLSKETQSCVAHLFFISAFGCLLPVPVPEWLDSSST